MNDAGLNVTPRPSLDVTRHDFSGQRIVVMGLGQFGGGIGVARFLARSGADVLVTDLKPAGQLQASVAALEHSCDSGQIHYRLGEHLISDFNSADLVVVNPAVNPKHNRYCAAARSAGVPLTSEVRLAVQNLPNRRRTIGVTGTAGKSTVVAMIGHVIRKCLGSQCVHVGGNIGGSLLDSIDQIQRDHWIVLELSSFMLEGLDEDRWSPGVAVVTNLAPNHLDWHGNLDAYVLSKQAILRYQKPQDQAVLGKDLVHWRTNPGVHRIVLDRDDYQVDSPMPGPHNRTNTMFAMTVGEAIAIRGDNFARSIVDFPGLKHRIQMVLEHESVRYFNDSKSTTPQAAILAVRCFEPNTVHLIAGGYDKGINLDDLAHCAAERCRGLYTIGDTGDRIANAAKKRSLETPIVRCGTLQRAVDEASQQARPGQVILLSPGCASWDQFDQYEQRGIAFMAAVTQVTGVKELN